MLKLRRKFSALSAGKLVSGTSVLVGGVFRVEADAGLAEDEGEVPDVALEVGEGEAVALDLAPREEREIELILGLEIVEDEVGEVGDEEFAFPEEVDGAGVALEVADIDLEGGDGGAADASGSAGAGSMRGADTGLAARADNR